MPPRKHAVEVFVSYAHEDDALRGELQKHLSSLEAQGLVSLWYDREIVPGAPIDNEVLAHLESASVFLLCVSADFMASDYCMSTETKRALERHEDGSAVVIPIILRSVDWKGAPFAELLALPKDGRPVASWPDRDEAFTDVARGVRRAIEDLPTTRPEPSSVSTRDDEGAADQRNRLVESCADPTHGLQQIAAKAIQLAQRTDSKPAQEWLRLELGGYRDADRFPEYRIVQSRLSHYDLQSLGFIYGSLGAGAFDAFANDNKDKFVATKVAVSLSIGRCEAFELVPNGVLKLGDGPIHYVATSAWATLLQMIRGALMKYALDGTVPKLRPRAEWRQEDGGTGETEDG